MHTDAKKRRLLRSLLCAVASVMVLSDNALKKIAYKDNVQNQHV